MATETEPMPPDFDEATAWTTIEELRADIAATRGRRNDLEAEKTEALEQLEAARTQIQANSAEAERLASVQAEIGRLRTQRVAEATIEQPVAQDEVDVTPAEPPAPRLVPALTPGHGASFDYVPDLDDVVRKVRSASKSRY